MDEGEFEAVGHTEPFDNVLDFSSRGKLPYVAPPEPEPTPRERICGREVDEEAIAHLEGLIEDIQAGKHHGVVLIAGEFDRKGHLINYRTILSEVACSYPISFLGAVEQAKLELSDCAFAIRGEGTQPELDDYSDEDLLLTED